MNEIIKVNYENDRPTVLARDLYQFLEIGSDYNMPTQRAMEMGLFEIKETTIVHADGHTHINKTPKVTGKGQVYFVNLFLSGKAGKEWVR